MDGEDVAVRRAALIITPTADSSAGNDRAVNQRAFNASRLPAGMRRPPVAMMDTITAVADGDGADEISADRGTGWGRQAIGHRSFSSTCATVRAGDPLVQQQRQQRSISLCGDMWTLPVNSHPIHRGTLPSSLYRRPSGVSVAAPQAVEPTVLLATNSTATPLLEYARAHNRSYDNIHLTAAAARDFDVASAFMNGDGHGGYSQENGTDIHDNNNDDCSSERAQLNVRSAQRQNHLIRKRHSLHAQPPAAPLRAAMMSPQVHSENSAVTMPRGSTYGTSAAGWKSGYPGAVGGTMWSPSAVVVRPARTERLASDASATTARSGPYVSTASNTALDDGDETVTKGSDGETLTKGSDGKTLTTSSDGAQHKEAVPDTSHVTVSTRRPTLMLNERPSRENGATRLELDLADFLDGTRPLPLGPMAMVWTTMANGNANIMASSTVSKRTLPSVVTPVVPTFRVHGCVSLSDFGFILKAERLRSAGDKHGKPVYIKFIDRHSEGNVLPCSLTILTSTLTFAHLTSTLTFALLTSTHSLSVCRRACQPRAYGTCVAATQGYAPSASVH